MVRYLNKGKILQEFPQIVGPTNVVFDQDITKIISWDENLKILTLWDINSAKELHTFSHSMINIQEAFLCNSKKKVLALSLNN